MDKSWYKKHAIGLREMILSTPRDKLYVVLRNFPEGACGFTTVLLMYHLELCGMQENMSYVCGMFEGRSHAWLETEKYIIDLTADQFEDFKDEYVLSKPSSWHSKWKDQEGDLRSLESYDSRTQAEVKNVYSNLLRYQQNPEANSTYGKL